MKTFAYTKLIFIAVFFLMAASFAEAANLGDIVNFNVDKSFDVNSRTQIAATLVKISANLYFYIEKSWWDSQSQVKQGEILNNLDALSNEFNGNIYPNLVSNFGSEWNPGIDNDPRITVLFENMNSNEGGYFREMDEYIKLQVPTSNEREMVYLSLDRISDPRLKIILAHEFIHLITFNQKNKIFGVEEDTWLNEARAGYSSNILGYDNDFNNSNLQQRVRDFIENPSDSITDWANTKYDYASVDLFTNYLVGHYGVNILIDSLKSKSVGIESLNEALSKNGSKENFAQIFSNWTIALAINDCSQNSEYCYKDKNLAGLKVNPALIFLPLSGNSSLSSSNVTKNWAGNWQKIIGGNGNLTLEFSSSISLNFSLPYVIYDKSNNYSVKFLGIGSNGKGELDIPNFGTDYKSLIIIPSLQAKISGFDGLDLIYPYNFTLSITGKDTQTDQALIQKLLAQIEYLKGEIAKIKSQGSLTVQPACSQINNNLYFGMSNNNDVKCLQEFLKSQGADIYPEGFITGNFGNLTKNAVIKFQAKYGIAQTGYVGPITRSKINQMLLAR